MSRIGKNPIIIDEGVDVVIEGNLVKVNGPKGKLEYEFPQGVIVKNDGKIINVEIESQENKNLWGLVRTLIFNMVYGVKNGYEKKLKLIGVGYNSRIQGSSIILNLGYSHPINFELPKGISAIVEKDPKGVDIITLSGIDKQLLGQVTAKIRTLRLPEPYKGKGVRYFDEVIKLKAGKTAKK